jgi:hypothetical protein
MFRKYLIAVLAGLAVNFVVRYVLDMLSQDIAELRED